VWTDKEVLQVFGCAIVVQVPHEDWSEVCTANHGFIAVVVVVVVVGGGGVGTCSGVTIVTVIVTAIVIGIVWVLLVVVGDFHGVIHFQWWLTVAAVAATIEVVDGMDVVHGGIIMFVVLFFALFCSLSFLRACDCECVCVCVCVCVFFFFLA